MLNSGIEKRFSYADHLAARFNQNRQAVHDELELWVDWWRDLLLVKAASPDKITNIDFASDIRRVAEYYTLSQIRTFINQLQETMVQLKLNASPRLALEVLMLNIPRRNR